MAGVHMSTLCMSTQSIQQGNQHPSDMDNISVITLSISVMRITTCSLEQGQDLRDPMYRHISSWVSGLFSWFFFVSRHPQNLPGADLCLRWVSPRWGGGVCSLWVGGVEAKKRIVYPKSTPNFGPL